MQSELFLASSPVFFFLGLPGILEGGHVMRPLEGGHVMRLVEGLDGEGG